MTAASPRSRCSAIERHGSAGAIGLPALQISNEIPSGERMNAMWPSRGGRLMVTPAFMQLVAEGVDIVHAIGEMAEIAAALIFLLRPSYR